MIQRHDIKGLSPQPLPSWYRGVQFRSRMEARWAAYFDLLNLNWIYEPEGYELPSGNYCPDFQINDMLLEVKPNKEAANYVLPKLMDLASMLTESNRANIYCLIGNPSSESNQLMVDADGWGINCAFNWYSFVRKMWGVPYYGDWEHDAYCEEDEFNLRIIYSMRFEKGICNDDLRGKGHPECR